MLRAGVVTAVQKETMVGGDANFTKWQEDTANKKHKRPEMYDLTIYTDGGCSGNPGPGGWAWAASHIHYDYGFDPKTTNQRMELTAVLKALETVNRKGLKIVSDSTYVVNCFKEKWYVGWERRGWRNSSKLPVANQDLWKPLLEIALANEIQFSWIKGHSGHPMNEFVDALAVKAYKK